MLYDFIIIGSLISTSVLLFFISFSIQAGSGLPLSNNKMIDEKFHIHLNKQNLYIKIILFFLVTVIVTRTVFLISFPIELNKYNFGNHFLSERFFFITAQGVITFCYFLFLFAFLVFFNLKLNYRIIYMRRVSKLVLFFILADILFSAILYFKINYNMILPLNMKFTGFWFSDFILINLEKINLLFFIALLLFFLMNARLRKQTKMFYFVTYNVVFIALELLLLCLTVYNLSYFFASESLLYSALDLFSYRLWYVGSTWIILILCSIGGHIATQIFIKIKNQLINSNYSTNYIININRTTLVIIIGLSIIAELKYILEFIYG